MAILSTNPIGWDNDIRDELPMHSVHQYPAKFPAFIAAKAIDLAKTLGVNLNSMADVFCGCGTSAIEAKLNGINFFGIDIDPVAVLIARAKSHTYNINELQRIKRRILDEQDREGGCDGCPKEMKNERICYWFDDETIKSLASIKKSIFRFTEENSVERDAFLCIFSSILKGCSKWLAKSIKPQLDRAKPKRDPVALFSAKAEKFIKSAVSLEQTVCSVRHKQAKIEIERGDVLMLDTARSFDLIVSSPPYAVSYEYADLHQLSALWLDYTNDFRELRRGSIGSSYNADSAKYEVKHLNPIARGIIEKLEDSNIRPARVNSLIRYYGDMEMVARKCFSILNPNGLLVFVVGDSFLRNIELNNSDHFVKALMDSGFCDVAKYQRNISGKALTPYRKTDGKFAKSDTGHIVYKTEFVIIGRKK